MKGILLIFDGLGDLPHDALQGRTPLEAADMPNLDFLAERGEMGYMHSVKPGFIPESDEAIVSIFGNDLINSTRGQLEARGTDVELTRGDLAFRTNFATVDGEHNIKDRRAGRVLTTGEGRKLAESLNGIKMHSETIFKSTIQHRGVLVFRGGFSDSISGNDATYHMGKSKEIKKAIPVKVLDEFENTQYTAEVVNEYLEKAHNVLKEHPVNLKRERKGLLPANYLLLRGAGIEVPELKNYPNWVSIVYMPLEIGFARQCGMKVAKFNYPPLKGRDTYGNLKEGLQKACRFSARTLKKNRKFEYAYVHVKETDLPGHDGKPIEKKEMLEYVDRTLFKFLRKFVSSENVRLVVTADHSTPCKLKGHSADPVPVLFYNDSPPKDGMKFCEKNAMQGTLGEIIGKELLKKVGFVKGTAT